jgi:hypothetical protein
VLSKILTNKFLLSILVLAVIARIYFVFFTDFTWYECDTEMYLKMGKAILDGKPISYFPNAYPLLVALVTFISGSYTLSVLVIINIASQILTLFIVERILVHFNLEEKSRLIIVTMIAFFPDQFARVRFIMTEPVSVLFLMISIYLFISKKYLLTGFISYLTYSFRPSLILFTPLILLYEFYNGNRIGSIRIAAGFAAGIIIFALLDIFGITAPAGNQTQNILVSIQSYGYNINHSYSNFTQEQISNPIQAYFNFIISNPFTYLEQRVLSIWSLWGPYVLTELGIFGMIMHGLRFPFFLAAMFTIIFRKRININKDLLFILCVPVFSITIVHILFFSTQRHQFAAEPFVIILAVIGLKYFFDKSLNKEHVQISS